MKRGAVHNVSKLTSTAFFSSSSSLATDSSEGRVFSVRLWSSLSFAGSVDA